MQCSDDSCVGLVGLYSRNIRTFWTRVKVPAEKEKDHRNNVTMQLSAYYIQECVACGEQSFQKWIWNGRDGC